jgi:hypothetical protein
MTTIQFTDELIVVTCWCGINHAVPTNLRDFQLRQHRDGKHVPTIWCPLGHEHAPAGEGEAARLRKQLEQRDRRLTALRADKDQVEASLRATKGALTKAKNRARNGVCPECNRHFANVERHVKSKHPEMG